MTAEILTIQMTYARPANNAAGPDTIVISADGWVDDAVRGHHDRAREASELNLLILPATAVVTDQMLEFTQLRVAVSRQHFAVGVDVNARAFGLFQQVIEIFEIVTGNQNAFTRCSFDVDLSRCRMAVFTGFACIQNAHHFEIHLADFHGTLEKCVHIGRPGSQPCHDFMVLGVNIVVVLTENVSVFHIGRRTFQTIQAEQTQAENIFANRCFIFIWRKFRRLTLQFTEIIAHQLQVSHRVIDAGVCIYCQALCFQRLTQGNRFTGVADNTRRIEVNVSQR